MAQWTCPVWLVLAMTIGLPTALGQGRPAEERIGTWVLSCVAAPAPCTLRYEAGFFRAVGGIEAVLEVVRRDNVLVPVVMLRGLKPVAAVAAITRPMVSLRFDDGAWIVLTCETSEAALACAPDGSSIAATADALPAARSMTFQVRSGIPGIALQPLGRTLTLAGTADALGRLRTHGAPGEDSLSAPALDWRGMLDRALRAAGFAHGTADLLPWVARWVGSLV